MIYAYARVSTKKQKIDSQLEELEKFGFDELISEKVSGRIFVRKGLDALLQKLRAGDLIVVWKIDRLGRSLDQVFKLYLALKERDVAIVSLKDGVDTREPMGDIFLAFLSKIAENDFFSIKERQRAGIEVRKQTGLPMGRPKGLSKAAQAKAELAVRLYKEGRSVSQIMRIADLGSRSTAYKYLRFKGINI